jgi:mannose-6-phosphate isomerase-like protein (cupin superfamily)
MMAMTLPAGTDAGATVTRVTDFVIKRWDLTPYPGDQAPPHVHYGSDEGFCVLSGQLEVLIGDERRILTAGEQVVAPAGVPHTFATVGDQGAEIFVVMTPEVDALVTALHSEGADHGALWAQYNSAVVDVPGRPQA